MANTIDLNDKNKRKRTTKKTTTTKKTSTPSIPNIEDYRNKLKKSTTPLPYTLKINEFSMRGLNKYRNFLTAPECGCDGKGQIVIYDDEQLHHICSELLFDNECDCSAIFLVHKNGLQEIVLCLEDWNEENDCPMLAVSVLTPKNKNMVDNDFFASVDGEVGFHCYGLMIERDNGQWEVCE